MERLQDLCESRASDGFYHSTLAHLPTDGERQYSRVQVVCILAVTTKHSWNSLISYMTQFFRIQEE